MRTFLALAALSAALAASLSIARAEQVQPPALTVTGTGSIQYKPDLAHVSFGVRAEASSATAAAHSVNAGAQAVIDAVRKLGISDSNIATSGYSIQYQPLQPPPQPMPMQQSTSASLAPGQSGFPGEIHRPLPGAGTYVAVESLVVTSTVDKAGPILDAAVSAGANETYGLSFDTSQRDSLYRQALARAVTDARAQAQALASAAHVELDGFQSISTGGEGGPVPMMMRMGAINAAPIMQGTGTIEASVSIVYRIKQ